MWPPWLLSSEEAPTTTESTDAEVPEQDVTSPPDIDNDNLEADEYLSDGVSQIDYVLVYEKKIAPSKYNEFERKIWKDKQELHTAHRTNFEENLEKIGLVLEREEVQTANNYIYLTKVHCPWDLMCFFAEELSLRVPLKVRDFESENWSQQIFRMLNLRNFMEQDVPHPPKNYYTCQFKNSKIDKFLGIEDKKTFFLRKDRQRVVNEILSTTLFGEKKKNEFGIRTMVSRGIYTEAYPLHDGPYELPSPHFVPDLLNPRQVLYEYWARYNKWYKYQPIDHIRAYFGEKIGIYFAWLGFYTSWLLFPSILGVLVFLYGVITLPQDAVSIQACDTSKVYNMCPTCDMRDHCTFWTLSDNCMNIKMGHLFDHGGTVLFAVFTVFWAAFLLEHWKRKSYSMSYQWDMLDYRDEEEKPRPEYIAKCTTQAKNPVTGVMEPNFPQTMKITRMMSVAGVLVFMLSLVVISITAVIFFRIMMRSTLLASGLMRFAALRIASMSAAFLNLVIIMVLDKLYQGLAWKLTEWEMHKTSSEFEEQLIFKMFVFQCVNYYSHIFYISFIKGKFVGYPGNYNRIFGYRSEECQIRGCFQDIAQQLAVILIGKQVINNLQEICVPMLRAYMKKRKRGATQANEKKSQWEADLELVGFQGLTPEYLEMVLQFGLITLFVSAFPLAPLFALLNNWIEIRLDAQKFVCSTHRPVAERASHCGIWTFIMNILAQASVVSNAVMIAFTSEYIPQVLYQVRYNQDLGGYVNFTLSTAPTGVLAEPCRYRDFRDETGQYTTFYYELLACRLCFIILFEHIVFGINMLIDFFIPDIPADRAIDVKRERYLAKHALADNDHMLTVTEDMLQAENCNTLFAKCSPDDVLIKV